MENKMKNKNQFVVVGLLTGFAILGSTESQAAQTCLEMPGELHLISVNGQKPEGYEHEINQENRIRLNEKAMENCFEGEFCVEKTSIKTTYFFHPWTKIGRGSMTAIVNCLKRT
jgi:hypothetical protein